MPRHHTAVTPNVIGQKFVTMAARPLMANHTQTQLGNVSGSQNYTGQAHDLYIKAPQCCIGVCKIASIGVDFWLLFFCSAKNIMTCTNSEIRRNFKMTTLASV